MNDMSIRKAGLGDLPPAEEGGTDSRARSRPILLLGGGLVLILLVLALFVPVGSVVIAPGQVLVESEVKRIAHPTGGVITEIAVRNGEHVEQGQLLMRLDDAVSGPTASYSAMSVEQMLAQRARLEAERLGSSGIRFPAELTRSPAANARQAMADEGRLFAIRRTETAQLRAQLLARIEQSRQQIAGYNSQIAALERQRELIQPELEGVRSLWERELVTINRLNELERTAVSLDGNMASLQSDIARTNAAITEANERLIQLEQSRRAEAAAELAQVNLALNEQRTRQVTATNQQETREIRAPYAGTIEKIVFTAIGEVVTPAQPIMEIVPDGEPMVVEARISPADIDRVQIGQGARIRFTAFNMGTTPEIDGRAIYVATDRVDNSETNEAYFLGRIEIDEEQLEREALELRSGMPAEVFVETGDRSLISYLLKPLRDQFVRAFRHD
jgi:HlyD family secretion protein